MHAQPAPFAQRQTGEEKTLAVGDTWGALFDCAWFHFTGAVPAAATGQKVVLLLDVNGELCVFDRDGVPVRGLTNAASTYDYRLGRPGKRVSCPSRITPAAANRWTSGPTRVQRSVRQLAGGRRNQRGGHRDLQ